MATDKIDPGIDFDAKRAMRNRNLMQAGDGPPDFGGTSPEEMRARATALAPGMETATRAMTPSFLVKNAAAATAAAPAPAAAAAAPATGAPMNNRAAVDPSALPEGVSKASVPGIYSVRDAQGNTTYTDNPYGHMADNPNATGALNPNGASVGMKQRYVLPDNTGTPSAAKAAGISPILPTGQPNPAYVAANNAPLSRQSLGLPESATQEDYFRAAGRQTSANKMGNVDLRTHGGDFAMPNAVTDKDVIGSDAAYGHYDPNSKQMVYGAPQAGTAGAGVNPLELMKTLSDIKAKDAGSALDVRKTADAEATTAREHFDKIYQQHLDALKDNQALSPEDKQTAARVRALTQAHNEGINIDTIPNSAGAKQDLANALYEHTRTNDEKKGLATRLEDYNVDTPGFFTKNFGNPFNLARWAQGVGAMAGVTEPHHPAMVVRHGADGTTRTGAGVVGGNALTRELFGENGENAGQFEPVLARERAAAAKSRIDKALGNRSQ